MAAPVKVSLFQTWIQKWTEDELARQTAKALSDWGNAAEFDLVRATLVSGVSGTAASMDKLIFWLYGKTQKMSKLCRWFGQKITKRSNAGTVTTHKGDPIRIG